MSLRLNFACGGSQWPGWDNSDIHGDPGTTVVDMDVIPYPYENGSASIIMVSHALFSRHMNPPNMPAIFGEWFRILEPGGWLRIDDNPIRCWQDGEHVDEGERGNEADRGYPDDKKITREHLRGLLRAAGFRVEDVPQGETRIPCDEETKAAVLGNCQGHYSFTVECHKAAAEGGDRL